MTRPKPSIDDAVDLFIRTLAEHEITAEELAFYRIIGGSEEPLRLAEIAHLLEKRYNIGLATATVYTRIESFVRKGTVHVEQTRNQESPLDGRRPVRYFGLTARTQE